MCVKKFCIKTLGCKVNQYESQVIREGFLKKGYIEIEDMDKPDIAVINTCTVTSMSDSESFRLIRRALKGNNRCVVVTGCLVEDKDLDLSKLKGVDFIIRNKDKYRMPDIIEERNHPPSPKKKLQSRYASADARRSQARKLLGEGGQKRNEKGQSYGISGFEAHTRVFVKVQDGCDNVCSYCKVRVVRRESRSRPLKDVLNECSVLIRNGYKEIVLTGICLGAYGRDISKDISLSTLIRELCNLAGEWRLRLSSIEPKDVTNELIKEMVSNDKLCKHLHMPFQSGDNGILKKMNRPYKVSDYVNIVNRLRKLVPDIAISTDIMVGFPGETEKRFQNTLNFIKEIKPIRVHIFPFSKRKGTIAYNYEDNVGYEVKKEREYMLLSIAGQLSKEFVENFIGKEAKVLIEETRTKDGCLTGYTDRYIKVYMNGPDSLKSRIVSCQLTLAPSLLLAGKKAGTGLTNQKVCGILLSYLD